MTDVMQRDQGSFRGRIEDEALLRGNGRYVADVAERGQAVAVFVRSPHAFALIHRIDVKVARGRPGVLAVLTALDMDRVGSISRPFPIGGAPNAKLVIPEWPTLAGDRVLHVGQPVAVVVAETRAAAEDAAELVAVDYTALTPVVDLRDAIAPDAPQLWPQASGNIAVDWRGPIPDDGSNARETRRIIESAPHVARLELIDQRIVPASLEPRGATAAYDPAGQTYVLRCGCQSAWLMRRYVAAILGVPNEQLRVVSDDVGGAFGMKSGPYPEYLALLVAARLLCRPVHWMSTRLESFVSDNHARDMVLTGELALDGDGRFLALNVEVLANMGAFLSATGPLTPPVQLALCLSSVYRIPCISDYVRCVFTNTVQTGAYRGAGRPEANYLIERLIETAARMTGIDSVTLRRRNLITQDVIPYRTPVGMTYDSGAFPVVFEKALTLADHVGFPARRAKASSAGKLRGIGLACFLEQTGGAQTEGAALAFPGNGTIAVKLGGQASGQGHLTVFRDVIAARLGLPPEAVVVVQGDTALNVVGSGTVGSRTAVMAGAAIIRAADVMLDKGRKIAAGMLEAAEADIDFRNGLFEVVGTDRSVSLFEVATKAAKLKQERTIDETLDTNLVLDTPLSFPNGCHIAEVEVQPETGEIEVVGYCAVNDAGKVLNHVIASGQLHGGIAQGLGQVLLENVVYDRSNGQLLTGSFMDYGIPRADNMPPLIEAFFEVPCTTNPLGVKGIGESGTSASLAAIMNAIVDAIPGEAGAKLDMPATPEKIWRACQAVHVRG